MKGFLSSFLGWVAIVIAALVIVAFIGWSRVPDILANNHSKKLQVPVEIDDIHLSFHEIKVDNFEIGNVPGSILQKAFSAEEILVDAPLHNYLDPAIQIDEIQLNDVYLGLEFASSKSPKGNWTTIMSNLKNSTEKTSTTEKKPEKERSLLIRRLVINNLQVEVVYVQDGTPVKKLPIIKQMVLQNINSQEGLPLDQIMKSVLGQMLQSVFLQENLNNMMKGVFDAPQSEFDKLLQPFKGLFNSRSNARKESILAA